MINPIKPKPWIIRSPWVPVLLAAGVATTMALNALGVIALPHIDLPNLNIIEPATQGIYPVTSVATVGKYFEYDFSKTLINDLEPQGRETPGIYSFYLGSEVGFPPMGLKLDMSGVLKGIPTGTGDSKFQVCVKDVGGKSACRTYVMGVEPKTATAAKPSKTSTPVSISTPTPNSNVVQGTGFPGIWEGKVMLVKNGLSDWARGCIREDSYRFNLTQNGNEFGGTMTGTIIKITGCLSTYYQNELSVLFDGKTFTLPITGLVTGTSVKFTFGASDIWDYTLTFTGNDLNVKIASCYSPDPRCTTSSDETSDWWSGEFTAVRTK